MDRFENELKQALRRREPAGDFAARLMARVARERDRQPWWRFTSVRLRWATAAVAFCILAAAAIMYRLEQQRRSAEGEAALFKDQAAVEKVRRRPAEKAGDEAIHRPAVDLRGRARLLGSPAVQDRHAVAQAHGFQRVVGDVNHCRRNLPVQQVQLAT